VSSASLSFPHGLSCLAIPLRAGGSQKVGSLAPGAIVHVLEKSANKKGQARLRTADGWLSLVARDGTILLQDEAARPARRGVVPDDEVERCAREELAADMTAWLLENPAGDLSGWIAGSEWVKDVQGSSQDSPVASKLWPEQFATVKAQLLPCADEQVEQPRDHHGFEELRALGRHWAAANELLLDSDGSDDGAQAGPLTAPTVTDSLPHSVDASDHSLDAPATWPDARGAAAAAAAGSSGAGSPSSAAVSVVTSPAAGNSPSWFMGGAFGGAAGVRSIAAGDESAGEWTCIDNVSDDDTWDDDTWVMTE
jgi:hypothetical protein